MQMILSNFHLRGLNLQLRHRCVFRCVTYRFVFRQWLATNAFRARFRCLPNKYYDGVNLVLICASLTKRASHSNTYTYVLRICTRAFMRAIAKALAEERSSTWTIAVEFVSWLNSCTYVCIGVRCFVCCCRQSIQFLDTPRRQSDAITFSMCWRNWQGIMLRCSAVCLFILCIAMWWRVRSMAEVGGPNGSLLWTVVSACCQECVCIYVYVCDARIPCMFIWDIQ